MLQIERRGALLIFYFLKQIGAYGVGAHGGVPAYGVGTHSHWGRRSEGGVVTGTVAVEEILPLYTATTT